MTGPVIVIDPDDYLSAADKLSEVNTGVADVLSTLSAGLAASGGMAGNDTIGISFGHAYDDASRGLFRVGCQYVMASGNVARALHASLVNHVAAHRDSDLKGMPKPPPPYDFKVTDAAPGNPPSSVGDTTTVPGVIETIREYIQLVWPNANTTELRQAAAAWRSAASWFPFYSQYCVDAKGRLSGMSSAELVTATACCTALGTMASKLGSAMDKLANACEAYAQQVENQCNKMVEEVEKFSAQMVLIETLGVVGTEAGGELWANLYEGGKLAKLAARLAEIGTTLAASVDVEAAEARAVRKLVRELEVDLAKYVTAGQTVSFNGTKVTWRAVWNMPAGLRGQVIEDFLGQNLPQRFKTWDKWDPATGVAISIKSLNINTDGYQSRPPSNPISVYAKIASFAKDAHDFTDWSEKDPVTGRRRTIRSVDIRQRVVEVVIPANSIPAQVSELDRAIADAQAKYPDVIFTKVEL